MGREGGWPDVGMKMSGREMDDAMLMTSEGRARVTGGGEFHLAIDKRDFA